MAKKKRNKVENHIFTSFYSFNKWLHSKDYISQGVILYQGNLAQKPMIWGYKGEIPITR